MQATATAPATAAPQAQARTEKTFFYVIGGEFTDTSFEEVLRSNQIHGPFRSHEEALAMASRLMLHATKLAFEHPATGEWLEGECPPDF